MGLHAGEAEVEDLGDPELRDHDVRGLDVAVDHATGVRVGEPVAGFREDPELFRDGNLGRHFDETPEILAVEELHSHEEPAVGLTEVEDLDHMRMVHAADGLGLAPEALLDFVARAFEREGLERHDPIENRVPRLEHQSHRTLAELLPEFVTPEAGGIHDCGLIVQDAQGEGRASPLDYSE